MSKDIDNESKESKEKTSVISKLVQSINNKYKKEYGSDRVLIKTLGQSLEELRPKYVSTGVPVLDEKLGGGIQRGSTVTTWGRDGSGKTCLALMCAAELTRNQEHVLFLDFEPPFPVEVAEAMGIDWDYFHLVQNVSYGEEAIDTIEELLYDKVKRVPRALLSLVIIDSVNNMVAKRELDKAEKDGAEGTVVGGPAGMQTQFLRRIQGRGLLRDNCILWLIAQVRANISGAGRGPDEKLGAGWAVRHGAKVRIKLNSSPLKEKIGNDTVQYGQVISFNIEKNNVNGRRSTGTYTISRGVLDDSGYLEKFGLEFGYIIPEEGKRGFYRIMMPEKDYIIKGKTNITTAFRLNVELASLFRETLKKGKPKEALQPKDNPIFYDPTAVQEEESEEQEE